MNGDVRDDSYHESWNAFRSAAKKAYGGIWLSMLSMHLGFPCGTSIIFKSKLRSMSE